MIHKAKTFGPFWIVAPILTIIHSDVAARYHVLSCFYYWIFQGLLTI